MASQNNLLGYIIVEGSESQVRGGALITDSKGFPLDFSRTEPLRPGQLDRILYGASFEKHAKEEIILGSLLDSMELEPKLWICNDRDILSALRAKTKINVVLLEESPHTPLETAGHIETTAEPGVFLIQVSMNGNPLRVEFPDNTRPDEVQQIAEFLSEASQSMNVLEPFTRLQKGLSFLATGR